MGDTTVEAPQPTAQERELQDIQLRTLRQTEREQRELRPFVLQSLGLIEEVGAENAEIRAAIDRKTQERIDRFGGPPGTPGGEDAYQMDLEIARLNEDVIQSTKTLRKQTEEERMAGLTTSELKQEEISGLQQERQLLALKGELPLTEAFTQQKKSQFEQFKEAQARQGNIITGDTPEEAVAQSSPGIQALRQFRERFGMLEEAQRRGEIQSGTANLLATQQGMAGRQQQQFGQRIAFPQRSAGFLTQAGQAQQPFQFQRGLEFQAGQQTAANRSQLTSDIFGAVGLGTGIGTSKFLQ